MPGPSGPVTPPPPPRPVSPPPPGRVAICRDGWHLTAQPQTPFWQLAAAASLIGFAAISIPIALLGLLT